MIEFIKGELAALDSDKAVVEVGGVGFGVYMSGQALGMLPQPGHMVKLYTYLNVKEDALQLYGFLTRDDLEIFRLLHRAQRSAGDPVRSYPGRTAFRGDVQRCESYLCGSRDWEEDGGETDPGVEGQAADRRCAGARGV